MSDYSRELASSGFAGSRALRPKARLLRTLGNDLISSDKVAIIELVKNSYDADASVVFIRFHGPLEKGKGHIEIWDDGCGMDVDTLQSSWLDIATDTKKQKPRSKGGRRVLGEKGIGRLAAARLGQEMLLVTRMSNSDEIKLLIDWSDFDRKDAYLDQIEVAWEVGVADSFSEFGQAFGVFSRAEYATKYDGHGTLIQIDYLSQAWHRSELLELRTALTRLIRPSPNKYSNLTNAEDFLPDFQIFLELVNVEEDLEDLVGPIQPLSELQTPHYSLTGAVNSEGHARLFYRQQDPPLEEDIGIKVLWENEKRLPKAGPFEFEINVWDLDNSALRRSFRKADGANFSPSTRDLKGFRDTLSEVAGVSIYRDGFRVLPFGEKGDDWLGLDLRRVQAPTRRVSNNQIVGHVFIGADTNEELKDQSNREGILAGAAYSDLQVIVRAALNELETRRYVARHPKDQAEVKKGGVFDRFDLGEIRAIVSKKYPQDHHTIDLIDSKHRDIQKSVTEVQNVLSRYTRLATLGTLIDRVLHDGRTAVARLLNISRHATRDLNKEAFSDSEKITIALKAMSDTKARAIFLSSLFNQIEPFGGRKRGRPKGLATDDVIDEAFSILDKEARSSGISLVREGENLDVKIDRAELLTVLINLIQNAIYWTSTRLDETEKKIIVEARRNPDSSMSLMVSDSGPGVKESIRDHIFDPYFSSKPDGVGLGLSIVGNLVEEIYGGELLLTNEGPLSGATFEAIFRRRVQ